MNNLKNNFAFFALIIGLLLTFSHTAQAQDVADGVDPNVNNTVSAITVQTDGKILIGGFFTTLNGGTVTRNRIARLNTDGTVDTTFNPNASSFVYAITVQTDGKILLGGIFTTVGGVARNRIARLNADGTVDTTFNPNANNDVQSIVVQTDGKILISGGFTTVNGGTARSGFARLNSNGTVDTTFVNPNINSSVNKIAVQTDGKIIIGGSFTTLNGGRVTRNRIARLEFAPTAADVSVAGRVRTSNGKGLVNAFVILTDMSGNQRLARTSAFGYFRFADVSAGETYIVQVNSKRYHFTSQVLSINQDITDLELTGENPFFKSSR